MLRANTHMLKKTNKYNNSNNNKAIPKKYRLHCNECARAHTTQSVGNTAPHIHPFQRGCGDMQSYINTIKNIYKQVRAQKRPVKNSQSNFDACRTLG